MTTDQVNYTNQYKSIHTPGVWMKLSQDSTKQMSIQFHTV